MKVVIAAGCHDCGWELASLVLAKMGPDTIGDRYLDWLNVLCPDNFQEPNDSTRSIHPQPDMLEGIKRILNSTADSDILLADSRNLQLLEFWNKEYPQATFLFFYTDAEVAIANAVSKGQDFQRFIKSWHDANNRMLQFQRKNRNKVLLFNAHDFIAQPQKIIKVCDRIGLVLKRHENAIPVSNMPPLEYLITAYCVANDSSIQNLKAELEASACPLGAPVQAVKLEPMVVINEYKKLQSKAFDCEKAEKETELLIKQLHQVQEELEAVFLQKHSLESEHQRIEQIKLDLQAKEKEYSERDRFLVMIKESVFWKSTAAIRAIIRLLRLNNAAKIRTQVKLIKSSSYFNEDWYLSQYPDVKKEGVDPVEHYIRFGATEGRNPSPDFNSSNYLKMNPDVEKAGVNPLVHFLQYGRVEGRNPGA